ncbi:MAG TPA: YkgJ family cysteine cluster protein [Chitinophagaceae bacterium]|nr:YkgJ family cysteine cluster protein [Chitinophagaceae bacterium]
MPKKIPIRIRSFRIKAQKNRNSFRRWLTKLEKQTPRGIDKTIATVEKEVWQETDCLTCANCCKTMTPTFSTRDIKRIAAYLQMSVADFKKKWLQQERGGDRDWINKKEPCQFLNLKDNKCSIYEVRPADCAGFPHLSKKFKDYSHVHKQNVELCPATFRLVEKMKGLMAAKN